jgi:flagellar biosynthesis GTPase FlhF
MFKPDDIVVLGPNGVQYSKYIRDRVRLLAGRRIKDIMDFETNRSYFSYLDNHDNVKVYKLADFRYDFGITQPKASLIIIRHANESEDEESDEDEEESDEEESDEESEDEDEESESEDEESESEDEESDEEESDEESDEEESDEESDEDEEESDEESDEDEEESDEESDEEVNGLTFNYIYFMLIYFYLVWLNQPQIIVC